MAEHENMSLVGVGHEAEWAEINDRQLSEELEFSKSMSIAERVAFGQQLSQQAVALLAASVRAGHAPERALWS